GGVGVLSSRGGPADRGRARGEVGADQGRTGHRHFRHRGTGIHGRLRAFPPAAEAHPSNPLARAGPPHHPSELTMPQFTASVTKEGLELLVMIGLCSTDMKTFQAAGLPVPSRRPPSSGQSSTTNVLSPLRRPGANLLSLHFRLQVSLL